MISKNNSVSKLAGVALTCAVLSACTADVTAPPVNIGEASSGDADFSGGFVTLGDSLTAGFADGALYLLGQQNSYPAILAEQFAAADSATNTFAQPLLAHNPPTVDGNLGGLLVGGVGGLIENRFVLNTETQSPERLAGTAIDDVVGTGLNGMTFNNMGVPGAKSFHLVTPGYGEASGLAGGTANPYFVRFASISEPPLQQSGTVVTQGVISEEGTTMIHDATVQAPSFYVLWIGNNDVLSYATTGGVGIDQTGNPDPSTYGENDITDPTAFSDVYTTLVDGFSTANPAVQGVLVNIADIKTIPYFTTVPHNPVPLDQETADILNAEYADYNIGVQAAVGLIQGYQPAEADARTITFTAGQNAVVILDEDLTDITAVNGALINMRQATASDLIMLPASATIAGGGGTSFPLADGDVLIPSEIASIETARAAYNVVIRAAVNTDPNLILYDVAADLAELSGTGIDYGNGSVNADFATGGAFSLDGVHPTARGYSIVANGIIDAINTGFNANVHKVDPGTFPTVFLK